MSRLKSFFEAINVKTIITITIIATLCFLAIIEREIPAEFLVIASAVVTYYFCKDDMVNERIAKHEKDYH